MVVGSADLRSLQLPRHNTIQVYLVAESIGGRCARDNLCQGNLDVPAYYRSPIISVVKKARQVTDPRKRDLLSIDAGFWTGSIQDFTALRILLRRRKWQSKSLIGALEDNPDKQIYLLSEMIHNPRVNDDLRQRGIQFLCDTSGRQLIPFDHLTPDDIVIVPAFGTTLEIQGDLAQRGIDPYAFNTTCPFVEKVWKKSHDIGSLNYTVVVHGKRHHEETRATFSHAKAEAPVVIVRDLEEAKQLARVIRREASKESFSTSILRIVTLRILIRTSISSASVW